MPRFLLAVAVVLAAVAPARAQQPAASPSSPTLDYDFFKARVQPMFTTKRAGNARCVSCHDSGTPMRLQKLAPGNATWSEEDSRKNFEIVKSRVVAGKPEISKLLRHPLAESAGGDPHHDGGKHWTSKDDPEWQMLAAWVKGETLSGSSAPHGKVRIIQTNSAGDNVHIIDPATNKVVGTITGIEVGHGAAAAPDGSRIYVSNEADSTLDVVDGKTLRVTSSIPLSGHPNNISISRDGKRVYVAIREQAGLVDVIDTVAPEEGEEHPDQGLRAQHVRDAGWPLRRRGQHRRQDGDGDRREDRRDRVGDGLRSRRASDGVRDEPRRLDQADVRPAYGAQRLCRRRLGDAEGRHSASICRSSVRARSRFSREATRHTEWR